MVKNTPVNTPANVGDAGSIPGRREWQPTPVFLHGKSHERGAWQATVHRVAKGLDTTEQLNNNNVFILEPYVCVFVYIYIYIYFFFF